MNCNVNQNDLQRLPCMLEFGIEKEVSGMYWISGIYTGLSGNILGYPAIPEYRIWRKLIESSIHLIFEMNY